jgi:hypothetical protein
MDGTADVGIEVNQPLLQPSDWGLNVGPDGPSGPYHAVLLGRQHLGQLASAGQLCA